MFHVKHAHPTHLIYSETQKLPAQRQCGHQPPSPSGGVPHDTLQSHCVPLSIDPNPTPAEQSQERITTESLLAADIEPLIRFSFGWDRPAFSWRIAKDCCRRHLVKGAAYPRRALTAPFRIRRYSGRRIRHRWLAGLATLKPRTRKAQFGKE